MFSCDHVHDAVGDDLDAQLTGAVVDQLTHQSAVSRSAEEPGPKRLHVVPNRWQKWAAAAIAASEGLTCQSMRLPTDEASDDQRRGKEQFPEKVGSTRTCPG